MKNFKINNLSIHTIEISYAIAKSTYYCVTKFLYSSDKRILSDGAKTQYLGFTDRGITLIMLRFADTDTFRLRYIINPARFYDSGDYVGLTDTADIAGILNDIGDFLSKKCGMLPHPMDGRVTRIDLTKNIFVGENLQYIVKLINRIYIPPKFTQYMLRDGGYPRGNATFTKLNKRGRKLFELSFYDKHSEMVSHMENSSYRYSAEPLEAAKGILRIELWLYAPRLKNMKRTHDFHTVREFLDILPQIIDEIAYKNIRALYLAGDFYKLEQIEGIIENSGYHNRIKSLMLEFIKSAAEHKSADIAASQFSNAYGFECAKNLFYRFNDLGIVPVPIAVKIKFRDGASRIRDMPRISLRLLFNSGSRAYDNEKGNRRLRYQF